MNEPDPDADLLERLSRNDPSAARLLVRRKLPRVVKLATRILRDREEAEDVAQETFIRILRGIGRWTPGRAKFNTFLHIVVLNLCRDRLRRRREIAMDVLPELHDPSASAESAMMEDERTEAVSSAIAMLPERQREAILLVHYQDMSGVEAATALNVSIEALESLLARGRRALRAHFESERMNSNA